MTTQTNKTILKYDITNVAETALHTLKDGNDGPVLALLEQGAAPNQTDGYGFTALHRAAQFNRPALTYALLRFGANPNVVTLPDNRGLPVGKTPLMTAAGRGFEDVAAVLIANKADLNLRNEDGYNALIGAIYGKHAGTVRLLRKVGIEVGLMEAGWLGEVSLIQDLLDKTNRPFDGAAENALCGAATIGHENAALLLLQWGVSPNVSERKLQGLSALMRAAQEGHENITRLLLDVGADPNRTNQNGAAPLLSAVESVKGRNSAIVNLLLERGANPSTQTKSGWTPLMMVACYGDALIAEMLLVHGADANAFTDQKAAAAEGIQTSSALSQAIANAQVEVVRVLLRYGANPNAKNSDGKTACDTSSRYRNRPFPRRRQEQNEIWELLCGAA